MSVKLYDVQSQHHVRRPPIFFFVVLGVVLTCFSFIHEIKNADSLITRVFFLLIGVALAPILVTTLVSRRYACCGSGRNAKHVALTSHQHSQSSAALLRLSSIPPSCLHQCQTDDTSYVRRRVDNLARLRRVVRLRQEEDAETHQTAQGYRDLHFATSSRPLSEEVVSEMADDAFNEAALDL